MVRDGQGEGGPEEQRQSYALVEFGLAFCWWTISAWLSLSIHLELQYVPKDGKERLRCSLISIGPEGCVVGVIVEVGGAVTSCKQNLEIETNCGAKGSFRSALTTV